MVGAQSDHPWDVNWRGWRGDEPPYHAPVFVLTHYPHDPIAMEGGTTFHFDGVQDPGLQPVEVIHSPRATHVRYRIGR
ncbi:MAG TPA: hypothetical protein VLP43_09300 [Solirubrobacteraceae bacterium]|nr:hypothetical protein [Solirubrobacteraceae bacterium]